MTRHFLHASLLGASLLALACGSSAPTASATNGPEVGPNAIAAMVGGPAGQIRVGTKYWARTNLRIVRDKQIDCDAWLSGEFLPMGSGLTVVETAKADTKWHVKTDDGRDIWIVPAQKGQDVFQEIQKFLAAQDPKAGFDAGSGDIANGIKFARPAKGMTRAQVLAACGFPPKIGNPANSDRWLYPQWGSGWRSHGWWGVGNQHNVSVEFNGDTVSQVNGLENE